MIIYRLVSEKKPEEMCAVFKKSEMHTILFSIASSYISACSTCLTKIHHKSVLPVFNRPNTLVIQAFKEICAFKQYSLLCYGQHRVEIDILNPDVLLASVPIQESLSFVSHVTLFVSYSIDMFLSII